MLGPVRGMDPWTIMLARSRRVMESSDGTEHTYTGTDIKAPASVSQS